MTAGSVVEPERLARYADKFRHAERRLEQFQTWAPQATDTDQARLACFKAFQEVGEALADVSAMLTKDLGIPPKDDYTNLDALRDEGALDEASVAVLAELNGLRNRLVHEYDQLDESLGMRSAVELAPKVAEVMEVLRGWVSENG